MWQIAAAVLALLVGKKVIDAIQEEPTRPTSTPTKPTPPPQFEERGDLDGRKCLVVGRTGAGKSSLINMLCGRESLAVGSVSSTTRWVEGVRAVVKEKEIVFVDTPGYGEAFTASAYSVRLVNWMKAHRASVDVILLVLQADTKAHAEDQSILRQLNRVKPLPVIVILNQVDKILPSREPLGSDDWMSERARGTSKSKLISEKIEEVGRQFEMKEECVEPSVSIDGTFNRKRLLDVIGSHFKN